MAVLLVRPHDNPVAYFKDTRMQEAGDIVEVRPDGCSFGHKESYWAIDRNPIPAYGKWPVFIIHVPGLPVSRAELGKGQKQFDLPSWIEGRKATAAWARGCWIDLDALDYRHRVSLEYTGHCWLHLAEAQSVFHTMTESVESDLSRH